MTNLEEPALASACRVCSKCGERKSLDLFLKDTPKQRHHVCVACRNAQRREHRKKVGIPKLTPEQQKRHNELSRKRRRNPAFRARHIVADSRRNDYGHGRDNDLDVEFVETLISEGCHYCGISRGNCKITLDRKNNNLGHLKTNVVPACLECNLTRGTMPYEAWVIVAKALREARRLGFLDGWVAPHSSRKERRDV